MKKFLKEIALFVAIQLVVGAVILSFVRVDDRHYLAATSDKHALLDGAEGRRIIFVGGSSTAFGIDCAVIKKRLPEFFPINMGLHAALGMEFMLGEIEGSLRKGDVVVLLPEYDQFLRDQGSYILLKVIEHRPANLAYITWTKAPDVMLTYLGKLVRRGIQGMRGRFKPENKPPYVREAFNNYGDVAMHRTMPNRELNVQGLAYDSLSGRHMKLTIRLLNGFGRRCERKGVRVLLAYAPLPKEHIGDYRLPIEKIQTALNESLTIPILNTPNAAALPAECFFDTWYHLGDSGIILRSESLADMLENQLGE